MKNTIKFDRIIQMAHARIEPLSEKEKNELKEQLDHGKGDLVTKEQLNMYLYKYGEIHQAKLNRAFNHIPRKLWIESDISVVDYGCGQGVAEMVLSDYLQTLHIDNDIIKDIILVEPSRPSLVECVNYLNMFYCHSEIKPFCINVSQINQDQIRPESNFVLHVFSNVIDLPEFNINHVAEMLNDDVSHNNIIICVSPFYKEDSRGKRMDTFGQLLRHYRQIYKFQRHIDEWKNDYSCQIQIFMSSYY